VLAKSWLQRRKVRDKAGRAVRYRTLGQAPPGVASAFESRPGGVSALKMCPPLGRALVEGLSTKWKSAGRACCSPEVGLKNSVSTSGEQFCVQVVRCRVISALPM
jgi:hypothetical protein